MITVDAQGLACPMPLLKLKQALNTLAVGEHVELLATDAGSMRDIHSFTELSPHELVDAQVRDGVFYYIVKKGSD